MHQKRVYYFEPNETLKQPNRSLQLQLSECLDHLNRILEQSNLETRHILKQTFFLYAESNNDFYDTQRQLDNNLKDFYINSQPGNRVNCYPPAGFIGEPPASGALLAMEITLLTGQGEVEIKNAEGTRYTIVTSVLGKEIHAAGITCGNRHHAIQQQSRAAFKTMKTILEQEEMDFSQVVRQWNYIENITAISIGPDTGFIVSPDTGPRCEAQQNYQAFNDVRSHYYSEASFTHSYPAATGIGMDWGGVVLEFIALHPTAKVTITPIKNPAQVDAHDYSQQVLVGSDFDGLPRKTTPKFERAKAITYDCYGHLYISGTAAIEGEHTVSLGDAKKQTEVTIDNIELLNPVQLGSPGLTYSHLRVYVKNDEDVPQVKEVCEANIKYKNVPIVYLLAGVCRGELLVEIEGGAYW